MIVRDAARGSKVWVRGADGLRGRKGGFLSGMGSSLQFWGSNQKPESGQTQTARGGFMLKSPKLKLVTSNIKNVKAELKNPGKQTRSSFNYRTLNLGSYKMFFTLENDKLVYKFF